MTEEKFKNFDERWDEIDLALSEYLEKISAKFKKPEYIDQILETKYSDRLKWSHEECGEKASVLRSHATYLQQEYNYHKCKFDWCDQVLSYLIAKYWNWEENFVKRGDKAAKLALNNTGMQSLLKIMSTSQIHMTALYGISDKVEKEAESLEKLQYTKRKIA